MNVRVIIGCLSLLLVPTTCFAQSNQDRMKPLNWAEGTWTRTVGGAGGTNSKSWQFSFTPNQNAFIVNQVLKDGSETKGQLDALFGYDRKKQEIIGYGFFTNGGASGGWKLETQSKAFTISAGSQQWTFRWKSKDEIVLAHQGNENTFKRVVPKKPE